MYRVICMFLFLFCSHNAFSLKTINEVIIPDFGNHNRISASISVVINGKLLFVDRNSFLWITNGATSSSKKFIISDESVQLSSVYKPLLIANNYAYFVNKSDELTLWKTDGEVSQKISDISLSTGLSLIDGNIYAISAEGELLILIDDVFTEIGLNDLEAPSLQSICKLGDNDHIIKDANHNNSINSKLFRVVDGVSTEITSDIFTENFIYKLSLKFTSSNSCYYEYTAEDTEFGEVKKYIQISDINEVNKVETQEEDGFISFWRYAFELEGNLFFIKFKGYDNSNPIYKIIAEPSSPTNLNITHLSDVNIIDMAVSDKYIYFLVEPFINVPIAIFRTFVDSYDSSLNPVSTVTANNTTIPNITTIAGEDVVVTGRSIIFTDNGQQALSLPSPINGVRKIVGDSEGMYLFDKIYRSKVFKISNQAVISRQLTGLWEYPDWQRQGMAINTGKRLDGSLYIFISFYMYKNGSPFWVAGNTDIDLGQNSITVDLFEFKGSSFLPNDNLQETEQISFGKITLKPMGCNELNAKIVLDDNTETDLNMTRIDDVTNNNVCVY